MPSYIATKTGQSEPELGFRRMGTLICDMCGERFAIDHPPEVADKNLAAKQADWLGKVLTYDHECQRVHPDKCPPCEAGFATRSTTTGFGAET